jgi:DNA-binding CsgD family transcriptional regulator
LLKGTESQWQRRLLDHLVFLTEEALAPDLLDQFAGRLHEDWPCSIGILSYDAGQKVTNRAAVRDFDEASMRAFRDHLYALNPYPAIVEERGLLNRTVAFEIYLSRPKLWKTDYYNLFMRPQCLEHVMGLSIDLGGGARTSFSLYRGEHDGGPFSAEDVRRLDMLRPHLRQALLFRRLWQEQQQVAEGSDSGLTLDPSALFFFRPPGASSLANGCRAERRRSGPAAAEHTIAPFGEWRILQRVSTIGDSPAADAGVAGAEVSNASDRWQLTEREGEVLLALQGGLSSTEIAERLQISVNTVRTHVKSIHRKSGFGSTRKLICSLQRKMS